MQKRVVITLDVEKCKKCKKEMSSDWNARFVAEVRRPSGLPGVREYCRDCGDAILATREKQRIRRLFKGPITLHSMRAANSVVDQLVFMCGDKEVCVEVDGCWLGVGARVRPEA